MGSSQGYNVVTGRWSYDCGQCGKLGAKRLRCPISYCYPVQLCAECAKATGWRRKAQHAACYESAARDQAESDAFLAVHGEDWVVISAFGSWASWVPTGMVGVCATKGGNAGGRRGEEAWFLVPDAEYQTRDRFGFVIDPARHYRFEGNPAEITKEVVLA